MRLVLLGLPPTTNNLYAVVAGRQVIAEPGRAYHEAVDRVARDVWLRPPSESRFAVLVTYHLGPYDRDVDGSHKALLDGLSQLVWRDDRQLVLFAARKRRVARGVLPYVSIVIRELAALGAYAEPAEPALGLSFVTTLVPPSTNNTYAVFRGRRRKTAAAREVMAAYAAGLAGLMDGAPPYDGDLRVRLRYGITADRRDVDGSHKLLFDAAHDLVWWDDRQITSFVAAKARLPKDGTPRLAAAVWPLAATRRRAPRQAA